MKKRLSCIVLSAVMALNVFSAIPAGATAEGGKMISVAEENAVSAEWTGSIAESYAGGTGTEADPYQIATGEQLALLASEVNGGNTYEGEYFKLTSDILLNDDLESVPTKWTPIGGFNLEYHYFKGIFNGNGHKVIGLYLDRDRSWGGLFGAIGENSSIENLGVTEGKIKCDGDYTGNICGYNIGGKISNCFSTNDIEVVLGNAEVGGICGYADGGEITGCFNKGNIYSNGDTSHLITRTGGVCGTILNGTITDCYNQGNIELRSVGFLVGGISGSCRNSTISNCNNSATLDGYIYVGGICGYNKAVVQDCYNTGAISGSDYDIGGICGRSESEDDIDVIQRCYNTGTVVGGKDGTTGGICGYLNGNIIQNCYNKGPVTGYDYYTAGICGQILYGKVSNCYNEGDITGEKRTGGIVGEIGYDSTLENSYNSGTIKGTARVGGIWVDSNSPSGNTITCCYNLGDVSGDEDVYPVGEDNAVITSVYYNSETCTAFHEENGSFAKTTSQLTSATAISDLGFDSDVWNKKANTSQYAYYPDLACFDDDQPMILVGAPVPTGLKATASSRSVKLTWDKVDGIEKYAVYKYVDGKYTTLTSKLTTNSYTVTGLTNGVKVGFKVKSCFNGKWSAASDIVYATPKAPVPTNVRATAGDTKATVTWDAVDGATKYAVYKYIDGKYTCLTTAVTGTSYTVTGLTNGVKVGFKVKAYVDQWSGASAMAYATPVSANIVPQSVKAKAGNGQATITWGAVSGATKYAVYIYKDGKYTCLNSNIKTTSYTATGLENGVKVGFKVKAYVGKWSGASAMAYATPTDGNIIPQNVKATGGDTTAAITWNAVAGAERYAVYIYKDGKYTCLDSKIKSNSYTVTDLENGTKVGFKVKAYINGAWSGASAMAWATPAE